VPAYHAVHLEEIPGPEKERNEGEPDWKPLRIFFGIRSFGTNAYVGRQAEDELVEEHTEIDDSQTKHEELYFVASGRARFTIDGEDVDAPAGTFVYIRDPSVKRSARAEEDETTLLAFGGTPGEAFDVSPWERKWEPKVARVEG
jgi:mannose-6-phosphate isomerase-like protein (cupin superfamily)